MLAQGVSPGSAGNNRSSAVGAALLKYQYVCKDFNKAMPAHKKVQGGHGFSRAVQPRELGVLTPEPRWPVAKKTYEIAVSFRAKRGTCFFCHVESDHRFLAVHHFRRGRPQFPHRPFPY